ncbi:MAG: hypothetical protein QG657_4841 [Acidobacteriota bacterium]|nr:hypothetical protein [Acidobacteriota bacterium]
MFQGAFLKNRPLDPQKTFVYSTNSETKTMSTPRDRI